MRKKLFVDEAWTMGVWTSEQEMMAFVTSGLHREAGQQVGAAIRKVEYARVRMPRRQIPPSWRDAERWLVEQNLARNTPRLGT
jgi:hypothetical protein